MSLLIFSRLYRSASRWWEFWLGLSAAQGCPSTSAESISRIGWIAPYAETVAFVRIITFFTLIIGELVPKRIALANPEGVAMLVARPMQRLATIRRPLV
ncbi:MAG TPA: CNNM domain-containing protein, partial [Gemmatimonadaceae bacterium]|nr:CNNM domain-containing protein [Gemmatimonadaceae bacterium]